MGWEKKPVGYLSKLLDPVSKGWPTCLQALVACALLVEEANNITFNGELRVLSPHNIRGILQQKAEKWITDARLLKYEGILLDSPKLTLEVTALQNPAQFLYGRPSEDGLAHECLSTIEEQTKIRPDLDEEELEEGDRLFVDGSSRVINGKRVSGYAIVGGEGLAVIESGPLSRSWSAQACELYAVLWALQLLKDKSDNSVLLLKEEQIESKVVVWNDCGETHNIELGLLLPPFGEDLARGLARFHRLPGVKVHTVKP
ncbi:hypothetical protein DUI87_12804 [Hirundo rustica rustica]|uniref:RNase H type-1 domain-containing protein n=1 Tax=Hirundo rustica rustica TaxID=333673 RepID=A0A3M0KFZ9_HIRRU|nr:hypothetical protein DUI87_12804 [Hirundo rustica rustica]